MNYGKDEENTQLDDYFIPANLIPTTPGEIDLPIEPIDVDVNKFLNKQTLPKKEIKGIKVATYANKKG